MKRRVQASIAILCLTKIPTLNHNLTHHRPCRISSILSNISCLLPRYIQHSMNLSIRIILLHNSTIKILISSMFSLVNNSPHIILPNSMTMSKSSGLRPRRRTKNPIKRTKTRIRIARRIRTPKSKFINVGPNPSIAIMTPMVPTHHRAPHPAALPTMMVTAKNIPVVANTATRDHPAITAIRTSSASTAVDHPNAPSVIAPPVTSPAQTTTSASTTFPNGASAVSATNLIATIAAIQPTSKTNAMQLVRVTPVAPSPQLSPVAKDVHS